MNLELAKLLLVSNSSVMKLTLVRVAVGMDVAVVAYALKAGAFGNLATSLDLPMLGLLSMF